MANDVSLEEAEAIRAEQRHEELIKTLSSLSSAVKAKRDSEIVMAIEKQVGTISSLIEMIKQLSSPSINIETNQELVVSSLSTLSLNMLKGMKALRDKMIENNSPKEWKFDVERDYDGLIQTITAKQI